MKVPRIRANNQNLEFQRFFQGNRDAFLIYLVLLDMGEFPALNFLRVSECLVHFRNIIMSTFYCCTKSNDMMDHIVKSFVALVEQEARLNDSLLTAILNNEFAYLQKKIIPELYNGLQETSKQIINSKRIEEIVAITEEHCEVTASFFVNLVLD